MTYAPSKDSDQPGHPPSLIRVFAVPFMGTEGPKLASCRQCGLWSDRVDSRCTDHFVDLSSFSSFLETIFSTITLTPLCYFSYVVYRNEPSHDKTSKMTCAQLRTRSAWHPPSLIKVFAVHMKKALVLSYPLSAQRRLRSAWALDDSDQPGHPMPRLIWVFAGCTCHFVGFVIRWLKWYYLF